MHTHVIMNVRSRLSDECGIFAYFQLHYSSPKRRLRALEEDPLHLLLDFSALRRMQCGLAFSKAALCRIASLCNKLHH